MPPSDDFLELERAILERIAMDETFASEMAEAARKLDERGDAPFIAALLDLSRRHRVRSIQGRAELAALVHQYGRGDHRRDQSGS